MPLYEVMPFQSQTSVIGLLLVPSGYTARMAGFFLYVSNTTSKDDGHLCFHKVQTVNRTPSEDQRINCSVHGRYVIYYNERRKNVTYPSYYSEFAYYELCELEVYGEFSKRWNSRQWPISHKIYLKMYLLYMYHISSKRCVLIIVFVNLQSIGCIKIRCVGLYENGTDCDNSYTQMISQSC